MILVRNCPSLARIDLKDLESEISLRELKMNSIEHLRCMRSYFSSSRPKVYHFYERFA
jgi:hypothetical protein